MDFSQRDVALVMLIVGILMVCASIWLERRRKHQLMPSLVSPNLLLLVGGTIALISFVVLILPG
jgi:predicted MFS family arabinose efflux permease